MLHIVHAKCILLSRVCFQNSLLAPRTSSPKLFVRRHVRRDSWSRAVFPKTLGYLACNQGIPMERGCKRIARILEQQGAEKRGARLPCRDTLCSACSACSTIDKANRITPIPSRNRAPVVEPFVRFSQRDEHENFILL